MQSVHCSFAFNRRATLQACTFKDLKEVSLSTFQFGGA